MNRKDTLNQIVTSFQSMRRGMMQHGSSMKDAIPFGQKAALFTIAMHESINIKALAAALHVTPGAATQHVEALVQEDLVERKADPNDRRNVVITLSKKGTQLSHEFRKDRLRMMEDLFQEVTDEELVTYLRITKKITEHAAKAAQKPDGDENE